MGQIVEIGFGKVNLSNTLATWGAMKVEAPWFRTSAVTTGVQHAGKRVVSVGALDMNGQLIHVRSEHENGTILLFQAAWKRNGVAIRDGALFLRLRHGAAHWRIQAKVPTGHENTCGDRFVIFSGYADVMNEHDLTLRGIKVPRGYTTKFMLDEEVDECFELSRISPETQARAEATAISTPEGIVLREVAVAPSRRLTFRRKA